MGRSGLGFLVENFPGIALGGIHLWVDPPRKWRIELDRGWEERRRKEREEIERKHGKPPRSSLTERLLADAPPPRPQRTFHLKIWNGHYGNWADASVTVHLDTKTTDGTDWLFGREHKGSGNIGVFFFSLPVTLPLSPILLLAAGGYRLAENRRGMSRHAAALLRALRGQLTDEETTLLTEAFRNDWTHERKVTRRVSLEEAGAVLDACDLTERISKPRAGDPLRQELLRDLIWRDDAGDLIGHAQFVDDRLHFFQVLGSDFRFDAEEEQAAPLANRFRSRTEIDDDADDDEGP